jgi:hypothetical protein
LRTTTRSSRPRGPRAGCGSRTTFSRASVSAFLCVVAAGHGCYSPPETTPIELFALTPESAANKANQTRQFETPNSDELLSASAAVLQDLGFQITEADRALGFLRAAKERSARERGQEVKQGIVTFLTTLLSAFAAVGGSGANTVVILPVDLHQQIDASLTARPIDERDTKQEVRIVFYRLVWKGQGSSGNQFIAPGEQRMEMIRDAEIYQQFYARLSKAVFLEAQRI